MRIAHLSDLHVLDLEGVPRWQLWSNKRLTGWLNLKLHRGFKHKTHVVQKMLDELRRSKPDHVVLTGDLTNLALPSEFARVRAMLEALELPPERLSVVPGNHDLYTRGAARAQRFLEYLGPWVRSDLDLHVAHEAGPFPFVHLRHDVALVGLATAVPRLPLVSSGRAGAAQLDALARAFAHPEVRARAVVLLSHHPLLDPRSLRARLARGFAEGARVRSLFSSDRPALALHGHLHERAWRELAQPTGAPLHSLGATSASLLHADPHRQAGFNVYDVDARGLHSAHARVYDAERDRWEDQELPRRDPTYAE